jgi:hypothetical protein
MVSSLRLSLLAVLLTACGLRPQPIVYLPTEPAPPSTGSAATTETPRATAMATATAATETPPKPAETAPRSSWPDYPVPTIPTDLVLHRGTLVWADLAGAIWTMPADGSGAPEQVSEQHRDGFASHPFVAGDRVIAKGDKGLLAIEVPGGAVTHVGVTGVPDAADDSADDRNRGAEPFGCSSRSCCVAASGRWSVSWSVPSSTRQSAPA